MFVTRLSASARRASGFCALVRSSSRGHQALTAQTTAAAAHQAQPVKALHGRGAWTVSGPASGGSPHSNPLWKSSPRNYSQLRQQQQGQQQQQQHRRNTRTNSSSSSSEAPTSGGGGSGAAGGGSGGGGSGGGGSGGSGSEGSGGEKAVGIAALWALYLKMVDTNPVVTKSITSAILNAFGDIMSQNFIEGDHPFDWKRLAKFTAIGLVLVGPVLHFWYGTLAKLVTLQGTAGAALRLALDQLVFAPTFIVMFFTTLCCFEGEPQKVPSMLKQEWWPAVITNWKLWVPFQFLNFRLVPQNLQVLFANFVALIWNTYLSFASHRGIEEEAPPAKGKKGSK